MTHYQAIYEHICADSPCTFSHVTNWAKSQGFGGSQMIIAIRDLFNQNKINIEHDGSDVIIELA